MLYNKHFYNRIIKRYSQVMGSIFSDIEVVKYNPDGTEDIRTKVPVLFSNKEKYIQRILEDPDMNRKISVVLPTIGYEMVGMRYAAERKLSSKQKFILQKTGDTQDYYSLASPVPYDFTYKVSILSKTQEDLYQIIEQIIPFFTPDFTISMIAIDNPKVKFDVPITLNSTEIDDTYFGELEERRILIATLDFVLKGNIFGPLKDVTNSIITDAQVSTYIASGAAFISDMIPEDNILFSQDTWAGIDLAALAANSEQIIISNVPPYVTESGQ